MKLRTTYTDSMNKFNLNKTKGDTIYEYITSENTY